MSESSTSIQENEGRKLSQFKVLIFDVYGTLVDWETGIMTALKPLVAGTSLSSKTDALRAFDHIENDLQTRYPQMRYSELLARTHADLETRLENKAQPAEPGGMAETEKPSVQTSSIPVGNAAGLPDPHIAFGQSIGQWPVFPDTIPALTYLSTQFALTVLSNVDRASFAATQRILEGSSETRHFAFAAIYTAEDAGAYKPDPRARAYALRRIEEELGVKSHEVVVVANSVEADIAPAHKLGLATAWINRQGSIIGKDDVEGSKATFKFNSLGEFAEAVRREVEDASR